MGGDTPGLVLQGTRKKAEQAMGRGEEAVFLSWRLLQSLPPVLGLLEFSSNFSQTGTIVWT